MIVVHVLMMSCHVSTLLRMKMVGAHTTISRAQNAKNVARLAISAAPPANRSKKPTRLDTSLGINTGLSCLDISCLLFTELLFKRFPRKGVGLTRRARRAA